MLARERQQTEVIPLDVGKQQVYQKARKPLRFNGFRLYGGIAQLGERLNGIQEVSGSIPLISTKNNDSHNQMCESLFYTMKNKLRTNT